MSSEDPITYTIISDENTRDEIELDSNTTVEEAIEKISDLLGIPKASSNKDIKDSRDRKVSFDDSECESDDQSLNERVEIFGLSAYTDRSTKFNSIKFPNNELIVYPVSCENLFLKSAFSVQAKDKTKK